MNYLTETSIYMMGYRKINTILLNYVLLKLWNLLKVL